MKLERRNGEQMNPGMVYFSRMHEAEVKEQAAVEIDHEIISTVILLPSAESFMKGCYQLQAKVCAQSTGEPLVQACQGKVWLGELTVPP